jgi:alginate O-acetyltransferase complex protein AlgJ
MKKFLFKLVLFLSPFIIAQAVELFVLPIDFFTFRIWEALRVMGASLSTGKFYPNFRLEKIEVGTLAKNNNDAVPRKVVWITDRYGYRNTNAWEKPDVVIIGDSFIAGDTLSQEELLSEVLQSELKMKVYAMAPANIKNFLNDPRFFDNPPKVVILERVEQQISPEGIEKPKQDLYKMNVVRLRQQLMQNPTISYIDITQNRIFKWNALNFLRARVTDLFYGKKPAPAGTRLFDGRPMLFNRLIHRLHLSQDQTEQIARILESYKSVLQSRGIKFIFLPVPCKKTIYYDIAPGQSQSDAFTRFIISLQADGITTINLERAFLDARKEDKGLLLYQLDDSHWNYKAVKITADLLAMVINKMIPAEK